MSFRKQQQLKTAIMQPNLRSWLMAFLVIATLPLSAISFAQTGTATVKTDKLDYAPGSTVYITGTGFQSGENVSLQITHVGTDPLGTDPQYHQPWTVTAKADGTIETSWTIPTDGDAFGANYKLTADGVTSLAHAETFFSDGSTVNQWADATVPPQWKNTLNTGDAKYFQGEITPFVYDVTNLIAGHSYTITVTYDYYAGSKNAGGYAEMRTYNVNRTPTPFTPSTTPIVDNSYSGTAINGVFYTVNADITNVTAPVKTTTGSTTTATVNITFTASGSVADIYWGMYLSKTGTVTDFGTAPTNGAGSWPGGSMQVTVTANIDGTNLTTNTSTNPGSNIFNGQISGMKYLDANKDGVKQNSENGLANWVIYLDQNNNDNLDPGEVFVTTASDGTYTFNDVFPNTYIVREQNQSNYIETQPGNTSATDKYTVTISATTPTSTGNIFGNFTCSTPKPTISTTTSTTFCNGGSVLLTSSSTTGSYQWKKDGVAITGANSQTYSATASGVYTVTITEFDCPNTSDGTTVTVNALPVVSAGSSVCVGSTITLSPTTGGTWASSDITKATVTNAGVVTGVAAGNVTFTFTNTTTGCSNTTSSVTVNALPTASASSNTPQCAGSTLNLTGGAAGLTYSWTGPNNFGISPQVTTQSTSISNVTTAAGGVYTLKVTDGNSCTNTATTSVVINQNVICATYSGDYSVSTPSISVYTATVTLVYTITGANVTCNSITGLSVGDFNIGVSLDNGGQYQFVSGSKTYSNGVLTAKYNITISSSQYATGATFTLSVTNPNFALGDCLDIPIVEVSLPAGDFVTGGGYIVPPGTTPTCTVSTGITPASYLKGYPTSSGPYTADGRKNNFGFNVKWNKSLKNLQGNLNTIIRGQDGHTYQVKSSQPASLAVTKLSTGYRADMIFSPVNFQDLTTGLWSDGGGKSSASITILDNGEPGAGIDQIFISVKDKNNNLWYSSNMATTTVAGKECTISLIKQGNLQVHSGAVTTVGTTRESQTMATALGQTFDVTATPNPTFSYFSLHIGGNNAAGLVNVKVTDVLGRVVETRQHLAPAQTLRIGSSYLPGIYIIEVQQGDTVKQLKLVKQ